MRRRHREAGRPSVSSCALLTEEPRGAEGLGAGAQTSYRQRALRRGHWVSGHHLGPAWTEGPLLLRVAPAWVRVQSRPGAWPCVRGHTGAGCGCRSQLRSRPAPSEIPWASPHMGRLGSVRVAAPCRALPVVAQKRLAAPGAPASPPALGWAPERRPEAPGGSPPPGLGGESAVWPRASPVG